MPVVLTPKNVEIMASALLESSGYLERLLKMGMGKVDTYSCSKVQMWTKKLVRKHKNRVYLLPDFRYRAHLFYLESKTPQKLI